MSKRLFWVLLVLLLAILACGAPEPGVSPETGGGEVDAKEAIRVYARDVLGLQIDDLWAGGTEGELDLPVTTQDGVEVAIDLAGETYFGLWKNGIASLSYGDGTVSGDFAADVRDGTLGVYAVTTDYIMPADARAAQSLIFETFPKLSGYQWIETPANVGYSFTAGNPDDVGIQSWSVELTGTTINAGVAPGIGDRSLVWVVTATGALAAPFGE